MSADDDHGRAQEVDAQAVARVPDREAQAVAARDHLRRHHDEPREAGGHPQGGDHLGRDGGQRHLAQQLRALDPEVAGHPEVDARDARRPRRVVESTTGKKAAMKMRKMAGGSPMPSQRMAKGIQARGERLRKKFTRGRKAWRPRAEWPSSRPAGTPSPTARQKARRRRERATRWRRPGAGRSAPRGRRRGPPPRGVGRGTGGRLRARRGRPEAHDHGGAREGEERHTPNGARLMHGGLEEGGDGASGEYDTVETAEPLGSFCRYAGWEQSQCQ